MQATGQPDVAWPAPAAAAAVQASIRLPGSKSITNRALVLAALADGPTTITGPLRARDTSLMAGAITALGASFDDSGTTRAGNGEIPASESGPARPAQPIQPTWTVTPGWASGEIAVDVGNAGTVLRFVPPAAALATTNV